MLVLFGGIVYLVLCYVFVVEEVRDVVGEVRERFVKVGNLMISNIEIQYMKEIAKALGNQNASIMVGAGFSKNARYNGSDDNRMLDWNRLADKFYNILYKNNSKYKKEYLNPITLAEEVEIMYGRKKLHDIPMC